MANISIFNHVLGPVMRGPSSSHSAAALRIGRLALDLMDGKLTRVEVDYDPNGSLVTTHRSQGSDMGLFGGFLGWSADDPRLPEYTKFIEQAGIEIRINYLEYGARHPNTYRLHLENENEQRTLEAISTGGGMIELKAIDGMEFMSDGDRYIMLTETAPTLDPEFENRADIEIRKLTDSAFAVLSTTEFPVEILRKHPGAKYLKPVVPVCMKERAELPFSDYGEMLRVMARTKLSLAGMALEYEAALSGKSETEITAMAGRILDVMTGSIEQGRHGTEYNDRILPTQVARFNQLNDQGSLIGGGCLNGIIGAVTAILEVKSSMGTIVAAPTAGSCGVVPGALIATADHLGVGREQRVNALLTAGLIGLFIAKGATFAAEEGGCMAECGSASGMVAAALVALAGGSDEQALAAASMALQNSFGMTCDPIANRVEAPCLGKNVMAASNALSCANMAIAGYLHLVPLDEVIGAMAEVGKALPRQLCCTALGGLSVCPTSKRIELALAQQAVPDPIITP